MAFRVLDVADLPGIALLGEFEGDMCLLIEIREVHHQRGLAAIDLGWIDGEVFDLSVLGVVKRIEINRTHLALRGFDVFPHQFRQFLGEVVIHQRPILVLEEGRLLCVMRLVELDHQSLGCRHFVSSRQV